MLPIIINFGIIVSVPMFNKKPLEYLKTIFMWFIVPYNGWKMINVGDEDIFDEHMRIVDEHWRMKVINIKC